MSYHRLFGSEVEAVAFAAPLGAVVQRLENESFVLPSEFWQQLECSPAAFAVAVRSHAVKCWEGDLASAWEDALEGCIRGVPAAAMDALDAQFRRPVVAVRWMVDYDDGKDKPEAVSFSKDAGEAGNEDGAWGSSSYDGWMVD